MLIPDINCFRKQVAAAVASMSAARMKPAAGRRVDQIGNIAFNALQFLFLRISGHGIEQGPCVGMPRIVEKILHIGHLTQVAGIHHANTVTGLGYDS